MERDISPPPTKRRKRAAEDTNTSHGTGSKTDVQPGVGSMRVFSWNINGVQSFLPSSSTQITSFFKPVSGAPGKPPVLVPASSPLRAFLARHGWPEVLFLQELKISRHDHKTPAALLSALNTPLGPADPPTPSSTYTVDTNLPRDRFNARAFGGKLYGVGTILRQDFASRHVAAVRHADWDLEGRVTIVELQQPLRSGPGGDSAAPDGDGDGRTDPRAPLALINVYAVNGTAAPYRSPQGGRAVGTRHDHKLSFHSRLRDECLRLEGRGFHVVVAGDLNVARGPLDGCPSLRTWPRQHCINRADFNSKFFGREDNDRAGAYMGPGDTDRREPAFGGVDVFRALRGKERRYTYHPRDEDEWGSSCDRVDLIIVSKALYDMGRVSDVDILDSPQERGTSDHVPLWVKLEL